MSVECNFNRTNLESSEHEGVSQSVLGRESKLYVLRSPIILASECYGHKKKEDEEEEDLI